MTDTALLSLVRKFTKEQLQAIDSVLRILDPDEYRDYHGQYGVCNAPDRIELLREEIRTALGKK
ncbi:MAG: hypothetical protein ThorAB25_28400 [Candidatus Thorarchaeota archaeon AB_25]|nr:MAG: hypothetical protein ThorAB25_28400 [Candidatus Thorarchaeota archaeon AB_25]